MPEGTACNVWKENIRYFVVEKRWGNSPQIVAGVETLQQGKKIANALSKLLLSEVSARMQIVDSYGEMVFESPVQDR